MTSPLLTLDLARQQASPRLTPRSVPAAGIAIHLVVFALWFYVIYAGIRFSGLLAWSAGLLYVSYDTWLLAYVALKTRRVIAEGVPTVALEGARVGVATTIGVIVAARNEEAALPRTLHALLAQRDPPERILVVDDGSIDGSAAVLEREFGVRWQGSSDLGRSDRIPTLQVLKRAHGGKARALNAGSVLLDTDVVLTVDADTLLEPSAIAGVRAAFAREPQLVALCGVLRPTCEPGLAAGFFQWFQTYEYVRAFISRIAWMRNGALLLVSGALAGFRREALLAVGGFDADCLVEDYELIHRLHRYARENGRDWQVRVDPAVRGTTDVPNTLPAFLRQRRRWFAGFLQTQLWNRDMTGNPRFGRLGTLMMPIKAVDTLQPVYGLTALLILLSFLLLGRPLFLPVLCVIAAKIAIDLCFHLWSVRLYDRWTGQPDTQSRLGMAALAALAEPFSFQLMRHTGAAWGWLAFVTGRHSWGATSVPRKTLR